MPKKISKKPKKGSITKQQVQSKKGMKQSQTVNVYVSKGKSKSKSAPARSAVKQPQTIIIQQPATQQISQPTYTDYIPLGNKLNTSYTIERPQEKYKTKPLSERIYPEDFASIPIDVNRPSGDYFYKSKTPQLPFNRPTPQQTPDDIYEDYTLYTPEVPRENRPLPQVERVPDLPSNVIPFELNDFENVTPNIILRKRTQPTIRNPVQQTLEMPVESPEPRTEPIGQERREFFRVISRPKQPKESRPSIAKSPTKEDLPLQPEQIDWKNINSEEVSQPSDMKQMPEYQKQKRNPQVPNKPPPSRPSLDIAVIPGQGWTIEDLTSGELSKNRVPVADVVVGDFAEQTGRGRPRRVITNPTPEQQRELERNARRRERYAQQKKNKEMNKKFDDSGV